MTTKKRAKPAKKAAPKKAPNFPDVIYVVRDSDCILAYEEYELKQDDATPGPCAVYRLVGTGKIEKNVKFVG